MSSTKAHNAAAKAKMPGDVDSEKGGQLQKAPSSFELCQLRMGTAVLRQTDKNDCLSPKPYCMHVNVKEPCRSMTVTPVESLRRLIMMPGCSSTYLNKMLW